MRLDGTMAADPSRCLSLLRATGPVLAPGLGTTLTSRQVVPYTTNTAYRVILDPEPRKRVLGDAAKATFDRFVEGTERPVTAVRSLADAVSEGHIQLHAADEQVQGDLVRARAGGALPPAGGDFLAVSVTNSAANKLDYYARRALSYRVRLGADRTASSSLLVQFENRAPPAGEPSYVVGPYPGASSHADAWTGDAISGTYTLMIQGQPAAIHPIELSLDVGDASRHLRLRDERPHAGGGEPRHLDGAVGRGLDIQVSFQKPVALRLWSRLVRFFVRPLL